MKRTKNNQHGFTAIEAVIIFILVLVIGTAGWYVYKKNKTTNNKTTSSQSSQQSSASKKPSSTTPDVEIKSGPGAEWNTYVNHKIGFSIQYPKQYTSGNGAACTKDSFVYDNNGNKVDSAPHYTPASGTVPATIIQDGNDFYIVEQYTYQQTGITQDSYGHSLASGCQKITTTADLVKRSLTTDLTATTSDLLSPVPFSVVDVTSQQDILSWAKTKFKDDSVIITSINDNSGGWQDVNLDCTRENPCMDFNYKFYLRYYKAQHKLVYLELGQAGHLQKPGSEDFYDQDVVDSFKLLN